MIAKSPARFLANVAVVTQLADGTAALDSVLTNCLDTGAQAGVCSVS